MMERPTLRCGFCGRRARFAAGNTACLRCTGYTSSTPGPEHKLTGGTWQNDHGIQRWVRDAIEPKPVPVLAKRGPKPIPDFFVWDWPDLIEARRIHAMGDRTPWAIEGNRVYKRKTKRRQRAGKNEKEEVA